MKLRLIIVGVVASLALGVASSTVLAQSCPNGGAKGQGYGGPPQSEQERAARQAACLQQNGGVCPNGGPRTDCPGVGMGKGKGKGRGNGAGQGWRRGARDGSGPRGANGTCPLNNAAQGQK